MPQEIFGMKPLFFCVLSNKEIIFASEIKAITNYKNQIELSYQNSLNPIFFTGISPKGKTMFKDVNSVDAGELLIVDLNSFHFRVTKIFNLESLVEKIFIKKCPNQVKVNYLKNFLIY